MFNNIDLKVYSHNNEKIKKVDQLWKDFMEIINQVKKNEISSQTIKEKTNKWLLDFANIYDAKHITPYMHCFSNHLHEFVNFYDGVNKFNLEGLEKLNHLTHGHVFRATNLHDDYLAQILKKGNRIEVCCRD